MTFTDEGYKYAKCTLLSRKVSKKPEGHIYGFLLAYTVDGSQILKVGRTNDWTKRMSSYRGIRKIGHLFFACESRN